VNKRNVESLMTHLLGVIHGRWSGTLVPRQVIRPRATPPGWFGGRCGFPEVADRFLKLRDGADQLGAQHGRDFHVGADGGFLSSGAVHAVLGATTGFRTTPCPRRWPLQALLVEASKGPQDQYHSFVGINTSKGL
jgi:hypothetical protein